MTKTHIKRLIFIILVILIVFPALPLVANAQITLTPQEQDYVNEVQVIKAGSLGGVAPLQYADANGRVKGFFKDFMEEISEMTGLVFDYRLYDSFEQLYSSDCDIVFGIPYNYAPENMVMSTPILKSETILFINDSVNPKELCNKKYAAIKGSKLPEGINEKDAIYYNTREDSLNAVEKGQADYGYGNAYSVAFYIVKNNYKNVIPVPDKKEDRVYCVGLLNADDIVLSIINKAISSVDQTHIETLIINATTQIDSKITFQMIIDAYGLPILGAALLIITILLISIVHNVRVKNELKIQYERYEILSQTLNEYLYEYNVPKNRMELSKNCVELFGNHISLDKLKTALIGGQSVPIIELPVAGGERRLFKSVNSTIHDKKGRVYSIIGKLIDVSEEEIKRKTNY